jgi:uncharacterized membrane protein YdbT with pleckstrin-like domain
MSYVEHDLIPGEKVLYQTGLHWIVLVVPFTIAAVVGLLGLGLLIGSFKVKSGGALVVFALIILVAAAACAGYAILARKAVEMAVTSKRVVIKCGLASRRTVEVLLSKVESIGVEEGVLGRMLGYGSVVIHGTGGTPEPFERITHPSEFRRQVQQQIESLLPESNRNS